MLEEVKIRKQHRLSSKDKILEKFNLSSNEFHKIEKFIQLIITHNSYTNIVGKSTLVNPWRRHILDSLQISNYISNKNSSILDLGTGAGIPGLILAMCGFTNISLVDSNSKKIRFVKLACLKINIQAAIYNTRIESLKNMRFDFLISRALTNLNKLFIYSQYFLKKSTVLIFLKGKNVHLELMEASKNWKFHYKLNESISDKGGKVLVIKDLIKINA